ncbi:tRNA (N6-threonylcarbamoyladenosine(37)-N6)-methyltransferase TrmO [Streptomyces sp. NRRL F-5123]|uniref:tRNA (N6-threonylcarbamoyladenosine(37)-N6)-methyltransferase TrmO n=1 Tax=Streptomyces sp. NRRL F-5123 TaxID=1463856 RepID=UPI0004E180DC|nr:tRNA (N6-threonylcarbamoyladenosine(37)-N6)-methyltransferase TrmO [Streptomyces sp. NRRL F-5123]
MSDATYAVEPIGRVESPLVAREDAPRQGDEGAPDAWLVLRPDVAEGLRGLLPGTEVLVLTWLDRADRGRLVVHPRGDPARAPQGVFTTRSPDRPNPVGLHRVLVTAIEPAPDGPRLRVTGLEALDGTPVVDIKPLLGDIADR